MAIKTENFIERIERADSDDLLRPCWSLIAMCPPNLTVRCIAEEVYDEESCRFAELSGCLAVSGHRFCCRR